MPEAETNELSGAALYAVALDRITAKTLSLPELIDYFVRVSGLGDRALAVELYKAWIAANTDNPLAHVVHFNLGVELGDIGDTTGAMNAHSEAIRLKPDFLPPYVNLGTLLERVGRNDLAVRQWMALTHQVATVTGDAIFYKAMALKQIGRVLETDNKDTEAEEMLRQYIDIMPSDTEVVQHWIGLRQRQCKWPVIAPWGRVSSPALMANFSPLSIACYADDPIFQLAVAHDHNRKAIGIPNRRGALPPEPARPRSDVGRLRIGYLSSDLRSHAVGFGMTDVVECHDAQNVEVFAYYCGIRVADSIQGRIRKAVRHWLDINDLDDEQAADRIRADGIDILVDLNGYSKDARTTVFAHRPSPIAVNWFGFPGSMGSPYHHYIIADEWTIPEGSERYYSEKVVRLPCYQPNDRRRVVSALPTRSDEGLPEDAVVYCCLNGMQKLNSLAFERWMLILHHVPRSVIWLLEGAPETNARVRQKAAEFGISPDRVIFARRRFNPDHVGRYPLADLFLDTRPYTAHTTAADALWMGVPVLTFPGRGFASRVAASLVRAAGLPELVCGSAAEYVQRAIDLGLDPVALTALRRRLAEGRDQSLLFDTPRLVRCLEDLYRGMWDDYARGGLPKPDLNNLQIYHEIGLAEDLERFELLSDEAYASLYRRRLAERHLVYPVAPDRRLWPGPE